MALTKEGCVYAWGEATCGQLGFEDLKNLPRNADGRVYQPVPQKVVALDKKKVVEISCGEAHSLVLTDKGHVFGIGANSCGQLGQYYTEMKASDAEEIFLARSSVDITGQSFGTFLETSSVNSNDNSVENDDVDPSEIENKSEQEKYDVNVSDEDTIRILEGSTNKIMPQMNIFEEKQKESVSLTPKLVKSLMHRRVTKISSGGVHNICIVEPFPNHLSSDLYNVFLKSKFVDVCFVVKEKTYSLKDSTFEEDKVLDPEQHRMDLSSAGRAKNKLRKGYYEHKIYANKFVLAARSAVFCEMFRNLNSKPGIIEKDMMNLSESILDTIHIKD